jgi:hypothetical protein
MPILAAMGPATHPQTPPLLTQACIGIIVCVLAAVVVSQAEHPQGVNKQTPSMDEGYDDYSLTEHTGGGSTAHHGFEVSSDQRMRVDARATRTPLTCTIRSRCCCSLTASTAATMSISSGPCSKHPPTRLPARPPAAARFCRHGGDGRCQCHPCHRLHCAGRHAWHQRSASSGCLPTLCPRWQQKQSLTVGGWHTVQAWQLIMLSKAPPQNRPHALPAPPTPRP